PEREAVPVEEEEPLARRVAHRQPLYGRAPTAPRPGCFASPAGPLGTIGAATRANGERSSVSTPETVLLGAIAGCTIFLGLPMGRVRTKATSSKTFMNGLSAGILIFLLFDILENAT